MADGVPTEVLHRGRVFSVEAFERRARKGGDGLTAGEPCRVGGSGRIRDSKTIGEVLLWDRLMRRGAPG